MALVAGNIRVPNPATGMMAFMDRPLKNLLLIAAPTVNLELKKKCEGNHTILP